jgi:hypothetical protein
MRFTPKAVLMFPTFVLALTSFAAAQIIGGSGGGGGGNSCAKMSLGIGANLNGYVPLPPSSLWNQSIANAPVDPNSDAIIGFIGSNVGIHPDFGSGYNNGSIIGNPYIVTDSSAPLVDIQITEYPAESDPGPQRIPSNTPVQGDPNPPPGTDRHIMVLDRSNCWLYEGWHSFKQDDNSWNEGESAVWDMASNEQRPWTWTAADAAGTPMFPGMVRYDEVASGVIKHALEYTVKYTKQAFTPPASHSAGNTGNSLAAPMGMRLRLKANYDITRFAPEVQVILQALKTYGMILVDNGGPMFLSGTPDSRWNNDNLYQLKQVTAANFEVMLISPLYNRYNFPRGPLPSVTSFTATQSNGPNQPVTLRWSVQYGEYYSVSPSVGPLRTTSTTVYPATTTTYTLTVTNQYGRATATVTVPVE